MLAHLLTDAFACLRKIPDAAFVKHPRDCKLYVMIEKEAELTGPLSNFAELFVALKAAASERISRTLPDLVDAHDQMNFKMRLLRYPIIDDDSHVRGSAHTDYGTFSYIFADGPGLEVETQGEWKPAMTSETEPVIVAGSSLKLLGYLNTEATYHRVGPGDRALRHSIVMFVEANDDFAFRDGETMREYIEKRSGSGVTIADN